MDVDPQDLQRLSDRELINFVHDLRVQIAVSEARLEPASAFRRRNLKLVRGTLLASGGDGRNAGATGSDPDHRGTMGLD